MGDIIVLTIIGIILVLIILRLKETKGKCNYCKHASSCPIKKIKDLKK